MAKPQSKSGLTAKQEAFCRAYVECAGNASEAYRRAYTVRPQTKPESVHQAASRALADAKVSSRIAELQAEIAKRHGVTVDRVVGELAKLGFANMTDYMKIDGAGVPRLDFKGLSRDQAAAIAEMTVEEFTARDVAEAGLSGGGVGVRKVKFKLHDKRASLVDLGKHLGMFKDIVEHTGKNGGPIETKEISDIEQARRIAFMLGRAVGKAAKQDDKIPETQ